MLYTPDGDNADAAILIYELRWGHMPYPLPPVRSTTDWLGIPQILPCGRLGPWSSFNASAVRAVSCGQLASGAE
jgi:hypothetical protein